MALPVANLVQAAIEQIYAAAADDKTREGTRSLVATLNELVGKLNRLYAPLVSVDIVQTDADDAGVSEFVAAEGTISVGSIYRKLGALGTEDLTDNVIATAKGSALVVGDVFVIDGADSIEYLGTQADLSKATKAFDSVGETVADFVGL